ncbi:MAG: murein DD-endopeptidase MepM/ murein hydrolase activator NlpD [Lysobacterales bacterium]|jgi:murein DD-endopeptidase MepM/ murein hydrolase activator NlpD
MRTSRKLIFALLFTFLPLIAMAGDLYKWQDEEGNWHFSDRPPVDGSQFDFVELPAEPKAMASMRKTGSKQNPSYEFFNHYHGPAELEVRLKIADNIASEPPLPTRTILPGQTEVRVVTFSADDPEQGFRFQMAYTLVPGRPLLNLPDDINFYPPFPSGSEFPISQGFDGESTHTDAGNRYAVDIVMPVGTPILAARGGIVMEIEDDFHGGDKKPKYLNRANRIRIMHNDGSMAVYAHLQPNSAKIYPGARVPAGMWIANSGNTGYSGGPHLHFVIQINAGLALESLPFQFRQPAGTFMTPEDVGIINGVLPKP